MLTDEVPTEDQDLEGSVMPQEDRPDQGDKDLFYPIILVRQIALMLGKLGLFFVVIMAMYAELDEIGNLYFGENGKYVTLAFVCFLNLGGLAILIRFDDFVEEVKEGLRFKNTYTVIKSVALVLATYGLVKFQYANMHGEESHSFIRAILKIVF